MSAPQQIVAAPLTLYLAPVGEAFPDVDETPAGNWTLVGTDGDLDYDEGGVKVSHPQGLSPWKGLGSTGNRKVFRTSEELVISLELADLTLENYAIAMNHNSVTTTAAGSGTPGYKSLQMYRGLTVVLRSLLVRGLSPIDNTMALQYKVPVVYEGASPELVGSKESPMQYALEFHALEDPNAASVGDRFGSIDAQSEAAQ